MNIKEANIISKHDVTNKYIRMLEAFSFDFSKDKLQENLNCYGEVQLTFPVSLNFLKDIQLLQELSLDLKHNRLKIIDIAK